MTDGSTDGQPLTPEQEEAVSRMLAAAGGPVTMPPEVADRLADVLADLHEQRATADVVELRARRRWPRLLLAAAAVVVGGYTIGTVATQGTLSGSEGGDTTASDSSASREDALLAEEPPGQSEADDSDSGAGGGFAEDEAAPEAAEELSGRRGMMRTTVRLRSDTLEVGVLRALRELDARPVAGMPSGSTLDTTCPAPELGKQERALDVRYDGDEAVLVTGPERGGTVPATVYACSGEVLDSTLVRP